MQEQTADFPDWVDVCGFSWRNLLKFVKPAQIRVLFVMIRHKLLTGGHNG